MSAVPSTVHCIVNTRLCFKPRNPPPTAGWGRRIMATNHLLTCYCYFPECRTRYRYVEPARLQEASPPRIRCKFHEFGGSVTAAAALTVQLGPRRLRFICETSTRNVRLQLAAYTPAMHKTSHQSQL